jgi:hypothetical protein
MILLDPVVEVFTRPDPDTLGPAADLCLQSVSRITGTDRFAICLAAVDNIAIRPAMPLQCSFEEALGRRQITAFAEEELNGVPTLSMALYKYIH